MEKIRCNMCGSWDFKHIYSIMKRNHSISIAKCNKCGLVYQNPRPSKKEIANMYDEDYFNGNGFDEGVNYVQGLEHKKAWDVISNDRLAHIENYSRKGSILDIGCGLGEFLDVAKKRGWDARGVELSPYSAGIARKKFGIKVTVGTIDDVTLKEKFDTITMFEVVEHLQDPSYSLKKCRSLLKPQGIIVVQTGDVHSLYARIKGKDWPYYLAGHLTYFSRKTLSRMLKKSGFKVIEIHNGDEISFKARLRFLSLLKKQKLINEIEYFKHVIIHLIRKVGFGGMTIYARKE